MGKFPTAEEIDAIFQLRFTAAGLDKFDSHVADDVIVYVTGEDHPRANKNLGKKDFRKEFERTHMLLDRSKYHSREIIRVIGGGDSPWAAVETKVTGTTKAGKPYNHECAYTVKFRADQLISVVRIYADTAHVTAHVDENKVGADHVGDKVAMEMA